MAYAVLNYGLPSSPLSRGPRNVPFSIYHKTKQCIKIASYVNLPSIKSNLNNSCNQGFLSDAGFVPKRYIYSIITTTAGVKCCLEVVKKLPRVRSKCNDHLFLIQSYSSGNEATFGRFLPHNVLPKTPVLLCQVVC